MFMPISYFYLNLACACKRIANSTSGCPLFCIYPCCLLMLSSSSQLQVEQKGWQKTSLTDSSFPSYIMESIFNFDQMILNDKNLRKKKSVLFLFLFIKSRLNLDIMHLDRSNQTWCFGKLV